MECRGGRGGSFPWSFFSYRWFSWGFSYALCGNRFDAMDDLWPDPQWWTSYDHGLLVGILIGLVAMWVFLKQTGKPS